MNINKQTSKALRSKSVDDPEECNETERSLNFTEGVNGGKGGIRESFILPRSRMVMDERY